MKCTQKTESMTCFFALFVSSRVQAIPMLLCFDLLRAMKPRYHARSKHGNIGTKEVDRTDRVFQDWLMVVGILTAFILHNPVSPVPMFCGLI